MKRIILYLVSCFPVWLLAKGSSANMTQDMLFALVVAACLIGIGILLFSFKKLKQQVDVWDGILPEENYDFPEIESEHLLFTNWEKGDIVFFEKPFGSDLVNMGTLAFTEDPQNYVDQAQELMPMRKGISWAIHEKVSREVVGELRLGPWDWNGHEAMLQARFSPHMPAEHLQESLHMLHQFLCSSENVWPLVRLETWIWPAESELASCLVEAGFHPEGILRKKIFFQEEWHDIQLWSLILPEKAVLPMENASETSANWE